MNVQDCKGIVLHIIGCLLIFYSGFMFGRATVPDHGNGAGEVRQELDRVELEVSQTQLTKAGKQSQMLKEQLGALKLTLEGQEQSLQNANRLLQQYEQEERLRLRRSRWQRNVAYVIAVAAVYFAVRKT